MVLPLLLFKIFYSTTKSKATNMKVQQNQATNMKKMEHLLMMLIIISHNIIQ